MSFYQCLLKSDFLKTLTQQEVNLRHITWDLKSKNTELNTVLAWRRPVNWGRWQLYVNLSCWLKSQAPTSKITPPRSVDLQARQLWWLLTKTISGVGSCSWKSRSRAIKIIQELVRKAASQDQPRTRNENLHFNMSLRWLGYTLMLGKHT